MFDERWWNMAVSVANPAEDWLGGGVCSRLRADRSERRQGCRSDNVDERVDLRGVEQALDVPGIARENGVPIVHE